MTENILREAQTDDAWHDRDTLDQLKAAAARLEARIQVIEFRQSPAAIDTPQAA